MYFGVNDWRPVYPRYSDVLLVGIGACLVANASLCLGTLVFNRRAWRRRTRRAGGGRALGGVPLLPSRTSRACRRLRPPRSNSGSASSCTALRSGSPSACCGAHSTCPRPRRGELDLLDLHHGDLGSGASSMSIGDLASGFGEALAPPELRWRRRRGRLLRRWRRRRREAEAAASASSKRRRALDYRRAAPSHRHARHSRVLKSHLVRAVDRGTLTCRARTTNRRGAARR